MGWELQTHSIDAAECARRLRDGDPPIEVLTSNNPSLLPVVHEGDPKTPPRSQANRLRIVSLDIMPGEELIVGRRLREVLNQARKSA